MEEPDQRPEEEPDQRPVEEPDQRPVEEPDQRPVEEPDQRPAEESPRRPGREPARRSIRRRLFRRWSNETIIALSALLISLCALTVSVFEVRLMYQQQSAMLYPHLDLTVNYSSEGFRVQVANAGNGLAMVREVRIWDGDRYFKNWFDLIDTVLPEGHRIGYDIMQQNGISGQVLPPGETVILMGLPWNDETRRVEEYLRNLAYRICYCSVMDECFTLDYRQSTPYPSNCAGDVDPARAFAN